jgi:hypothetical protein
MGSNKHPMPKVSGSKARPIESTSKKRANGRNFIAGMIDQSINQ